MGILDLLLYIDHQMHKMTIKKVLIRIQIQKFNNFEYSYLFRFFFLFFFFFFFFFNYNKREEREKGKESMGRPKSIQEYGIGEAEFLAAINEIALDAFDNQCTETKQK